MTWTRIESATIDPQLDEGLEARVADPLWLLARQWQTGEFTGDDAANPLLVRMRARSTEVDSVVFRGGRRVDRSSVDVPVETLVEREPIADGPGRTWFSAEAGQLLLAALRRARVGVEAIDLLRETYRLRVGQDDLDPVGHRRLRVLAGRSLDGLRLAEANRRDPSTLDDLLDDGGIDERSRSRIIGVVNRWSSEVVDGFSEPEPGMTAWDPERMEYRFHLTTTVDGVDQRLEADGYAGGRLEWYHFDRARGTSSGAEDSRSIERTVTVLPVPLRYRGMPAARFWEMEEGDVHFGGINTAPEDLARMAVASYATVYGDDWFLVPLQVPFGTLTEIEALEVVDDFGGRTVIPPAAVVDGGTPDRAFRFFELSGDPGPAAKRAPGLFLAPSVETADAGRTLEDVGFVRDELANLAWAVERRIESKAGRPVDLVARTPVPELAEEATLASGEDDPWHLVLSTSVPRNWVPLIPVLVDDEVVMFQRGRMPNEGGKSTTGAIGRILVPDRRLLIHEEEVPRAGIRVTRRYQSARGSDGRLHVWVGRRKGPGRGLGHSGLRYDDLRR